MIDLVGAASRAVLALPPVRGVGLVLEHATRLLSSVDREVWTRFDGSLVHGNPSQTAGRRLLFTVHYHDRDERAFVRSVLRPGDYAVDVGANIGLYTLLFARLVGEEGAVTAVEAEPGNARALQRNLDANGYRQVTVKVQGVSDKVETLPFHLNAGSSGMHSFLADSGGGDVTLDCRPLIDLVEQRRARLLKIDIEGFEYRVLKHFFAQGGIKPDFIMVEDWAHLREGDPVALCKANGYDEVARFNANAILKRR